MESTLILILSFALATTALVIIRQRQRQQALFSLFRRLYKSPTHDSTDDDPDSDNPNGGMPRGSGKRRARQLELQSAQQAEQAKRLAEAQAEIAEGARHLAEKDAEARRDWVKVQSQLEVARTEIIRGQDELESERREIEKQRRLDPIIAEAILGIGGLALCLLPLVVLLLVLRRSEAEPGDGGLSDMLIEDMASEEPRLLPSPDTPARLPGN